MRPAVFFTFPSVGHLTPELAVIGELARRGEAVHVVATRRWHAAAEQAGGAFEPYPCNQEAFDPEVATSGLFEDMERLLLLTEEILPWAIALLERIRPAYVLLDTKCVWGRLAAARTGIPAVTLSVVFAIRPGIVPVPALVQMLYAGGSAGSAFEGLQAFTRYAATARRIARRFGLSSPDLIEFLGNPQPLTIVFTARAVQPAHQAFASDRYQFVGASIDPGREADVALDIDGLEDPLVYVSLGTTFNDAPAFHTACRAAFAGAPWTTLISNGGRAAGIAAPVAGLIVRDFVPQLQVLQRARVFVTHGGMNSVNEGLRAGVPLLVVPQRGDQFVVAQRIAELGAGIALAPSAATAEQLRISVERLLADDRYREAAAALGAALDGAGGPRRAADTILQFTGARSRAHSASP